MTAFTLWAVLVRAAMTVAVRARTESASSTQSRERVGDLFGGVRLLCAHTSTLHVT